MEKSVWDKINERRNKIPAEEFKKLPKDASKNIDEYLYGKLSDLHNPKKETHD